MHSITHQFSLPKSAKFLGARHGPTWGILFFLHQDDWTECERWDLVAVRPNDEVHRVLGGDISQYEFLCHIPQTPEREDAFIYRKIG